MIDLNKYPNFKIPEWMEFYIENDFIVNKQSVGIILRQNRIIFYKHIEDYYNDKPENNTLYHTMIRERIDLLLKLKENGYLK